MSIDDGRPWRRRERGSSAALRDRVAATPRPDGNRILSAANDAAGRIWTKLPVADIPDGVAGLWYQNIMAPETMPDELVRVMYLSSPFNIHEDGLAVSLPRCHGA